jgi:hypothetical protein
VKYLITGIADVIVDIPDKIGADPVMALGRASHRENLAADLLVTFAAAELPVRILLHGQPASQFGIPTRIGKYIAIAAQSEGTQFRTL